LGPPPDDSWNNLFAGLYYVENHADQISVANISIVNSGSNAPIQTLKFFVRRVVNAGVVIVAAAGNDGRDLAGSDGIYGTGDDAVPAAYPEVMAVSAMDPASDTLWPFSNFSQIERTNDASGPVTNFVHSPGGAIDVAAPGYLNLTTWTNNDYIYETGTSFAAPHVTGLVALYIAANGRATNAEGVYKIRQAIIDASLPQSQWNTNNTHDPDTNPEPLAIASEQWIPQPQLTNTIGTPGNFQLSFNAVPGYDYTLQSKPSLNPAPGWTDLATLSGTNFVTPVSLTDTNPAAQNFYRLSRTPSL
jgi:subtilisin family serine protease